MRISPSKLIFAFFSSFYILVILFPRGIFLGHSTLASRLWIIYKESLYLSILLGSIYVILKILSRNIAIHQHAFFILQYYFIVMILTFMLSGSIGDGVQSIFYPIFIYLFFNE
ncbi:TPA: polymerase, partial [Streptococcus pneumoniae]